MVRQDIFTFRNTAKPSLATRGDKLVSIQRSVINAFFCVAYPLLTHRGATNQMGRKKIPEKLACTQQQHYIAPLSKGALQTAHTLMSRWIMPLE